MRWRVGGARGARGGVGEPGHGERGYDQWCCRGSLLSSVLGFGRVRVFSPLCPCPFLPAAPPKAAESEEETPETPQKNSNKKGKGKKSKKVRTPPRSCRGPLGDAEWVVEHSPGRPVAAPSLKPPAAEPQPRGKLGARGN